jgi:hypothetical protein
MSEDLITSLKKEKEKEKESAQESKVIHINNILTKSIIFANNIERKRKRRNTLVRL